MDYKSPAFVNVTETKIEGQPSRRLMIVLRTRGCVYSMGPSGGCTFCGFKELTTKGTPVPGNDIVWQFKRTLQPYDFPRAHIGEIDIYNSGSFLSNQEVPAPAREMIFTILSEIPEIKKIFIESRPEFIKSEQTDLRKLRNIVKDRILEVGIGLETVHDDIRLTTLNKGFKLEQFREACQILAKMDVRLLVYVLLKPPGMSEGEAIRDAIDTIFYVDELGKNLNMKVKVALQPTFVPKNTPIEKLYEQGAYAPPKLWSVFEVLRATFNAAVPIEVALSDEGLADGRVAKNCELCTDKAREILGQFNATGDRSPLMSLKCECRVQWKETIKD